VPVSARERERETLIITHSSPPVITPSVYRALYILSLHVINILLLSRHIYKSSVSCAIFIMPCLRPSLACLFSSVWSIMITCVLGSFTDRMTSPLYYSTCVDDCMWLFIYFEESEIKKLQKLSVKNALNNLIRKKATKN